ncbi:hypothetical protein [Mycolicibacterium gilvum]|uniref:hypothetical protein n=1 Tax=Mycolicibacterium gilvum TaxID=1804 RepID=UPI0040468322
MSQDTQQGLRSPNHRLKLLGWQRPVALGYDVAQLSDGEMLHRHTAGALWR